MKNRRNKMLSLIELLELKEEMLADLRELGTSIMIERYGIKFDKEPKPVTDIRALELMTEAAQ